MRKVIGLYGPYNMWYVAKRSYTTPVDIYALTYDDNSSPPCPAIKYQILDRGTPTSRLTDRRDEYERDVATKLLLAMMNPVIPASIRTFNSITDDIEIVSHSHVRMKGTIRALSELGIDDRRLIWSLIYPRVYDITDETTITFPESLSTIFAISSCLTPLIDNGGIMPHEERLRSTIEQATTIRRNCSTATIFLLESSPINFDDIERLYELVDYIFLFQKNPTNELLARTNKSLGESYVIYSLLRRLPPYTLFIKMSGRYKLLYRFKLEDLSLEKPTFRVTPKEITWSGRGVCESILYSMPYVYHAQLLGMLQRIYTQGSYIDIEHELYRCFCPSDDVSKIHMIDELHVIGNSF